MHPKAFLDTAALLIGQALQFDKPSDALMGQFFKEHRQVGSKERQWMGDALYDILRHRLFLEAAAHQANAQSGSSNKRIAPRQLTLLALQRTASNDKQRPFLSDALTLDEQAWLRQATTVSPNAAAPSQTHNLPNWLATKLHDHLREAGRADEFGALTLSLLSPATVDLRVNVTKIKRDALAKQLFTAGVHTTSTPLSPWGLRVQGDIGSPNLTQLDAYHQGLFEVQDEGSQLLALLVGAKREELIADFCAGAGGKTLALAMQMRGTGRLYAMDTSAHRLAGLSPRLTRAGLQNVHNFGIEHELDIRLSKLFGKMDRVLVDAPCTGLGTLKRSPDLKWRVQDKDLTSMAGLQSRILSQAAKLLKPGGRLVYATCSLLDEENESVAKRFETTHKDFTPVPAQNLLADAKVATPERLCSADGRFLRLWPHVTQTDGFFAAVWQRQP